jgi:hypothetical protein
MMNAEFHPLRELVPVKITGPVEGDEQPAFVSFTLQKSASE